MRTPTACHVTPCRAAAPPRRQRVAIRLIRFGAAADAIITIIFAAALRDAIHERAVDTMRHDIFAKMLRVTLMRVKRGEV